MKINLKDNNQTLTEDFPMTVFEIQDTLDKLNISSGDTEITFSFAENVLSEMFCKERKADIYQVNLFAERVKKLDYEEMAALKSLIKIKPKSSVDEILLMTYGLDTVPVWACKYYYEYGDVAIENEMMPELESCSDEILELLDRELIGKIMSEREGGIFVDGFYCVPSNYVQPDMAIEIGKPENCFFRLLLAPEPQDDELTEHLGQWISLPCSREQFDKVSKSLGIEKVEDAVYYAFESALPLLTEEKFGDMRRISELNSLANKLSKLSDFDFVKLKAVLETEGIKEIPDTVGCINRLSEYDFDASVQYSDDFGKKYLTHYLPQEFNLSLLDKAELHGMGYKLLDYINGDVTSYGVISGRGQKLYDPILIDQSQEIVEDEFQDYEIEMEEMSL